MTEPAQKRPLPIGYTVEEVAEALRLKPCTIREYAKAGLLRAVKVGNVWRFSWTAVEEFLEGKEENECRSSEKTTASTTPTNVTHLDDEYARLLRQGTKRRRKSGTPSS